MQHDRAAIHTRRLMLVAIALIALAIFLLFKSAMAQPEFTIRNATFLHAVIGGMSHG